MEFTKKRIFAFVAIVASAVVGGFAHADNYYFRLRPSINILKQPSFSIRIDGDRVGVVGAPFAAKAEVSAPREMLRFSILEGNLPPGVTLNSTSGIISGQPTVKGAFNATIAAQDAFSTVNATLAVTVYDEIEIESTVPPYAMVGKPYSAGFQVIGGDHNYNWEIEGTPPDGLNLNNSAAAASVMSGTPTTAGTFAGLRVKVSDGAGHSATSSAFSIAVADPLVLSGIPSDIGVIGNSYLATFATAGGHAPFEWSMSGTLPPGLSFSDGSISGTPTTAGTYSNIVVQVTDIAGNVVSSSPFSIAIPQPLEISGTPPAFGTVGETYAATFTTSGGDGNYSWILKGGDLPDGLAFANGVVSGIPTRTGTWSGIVIESSDGNGQKISSNPFKIVVSQPLEVSGPAPDVGRVGEAYAMTFTASGGDGNYSWAAVSPLPNGLSLSNGTISGTPTTAGTYTNLIVRVTDGNGRTTQAVPFSITVLSAPAVSGTPSGIGTVGVAYAATFAASGGTGGYTWSSVGNALPPGLAFANGVISGKPTTKGTYSNIVIRATDSSGRVATAPAFSIVVSDPLVFIGLPPAGTVGIPYSFTYSISGGSGNYGWSIYGNLLPPGLTLSNGTISGTPTTAGTYSNLSILVTDGDGRTISATPYSITIYNW